MQPPDRGAPSRRSLWLQAMPAIVVAALMLGGAVWVYRKGRPQSTTSPRAPQGQAELEAVRRGRSCIELGLYREAIPYLRAAQAARPDEPEVHYLLGVALADTGAMDDALPHLQQAALARPNVERYQVELAKAYRRLGRYNEARDACLQALRNNPSDVDVHIELGFIYGKQRRYSEARLHFRTALTLDPDNRIAKMNLEVLRTLPGEAPPEE